MSAKLPAVCLSGADYSAVELSDDDASVILLDQRLLPLEELYVELRGPAEMVRAIREMWVRGAPAIGIAAAYGVVLAARMAESSAEFDTMVEAIGEARPTAVNLRWAVERMKRVAKAAHGLGRHERVALLAAEARQLHRQDVAANRTMGALGAQYLPDGASVLTHCNAGALATGGYGTALGVIRAAVEAGKRLRVFADETRPWLQGARLTAWELARDGFDVTVISDNCAASLFGQGRLGLAIVGADRIALNGDVANKVGTYGVACLARLHDRPFYVAAPLSTLDRSTPSGDAITIEQREPAEVLEFAGRRMAPVGVAAINPSFDVTPARLVSGLFTEAGVALPVTPESVGRLLGSLD